MALPCAQRMNEQQGRLWTELPSGRLNSLPRMLFSLSSSHVHPLRCQPQQVSESVCLTGFSLAAVGGWGGVPLSEASNLWGQCEGRRDPEESWTCKVRICYWNDKSTSWRFTKSPPSQKNNSPVDRRECGRVSREEKVSKKIRRSFFFSLQPISA